MSLQWYHGALGVGMRSQGRVWVRCPDWDYLKYHHLSLRQLTRSLPHPVTLRQVCYVSCLLKSRVWKRVNIGTEKARTMASVRITAGSFRFQLKRFLLRESSPYFLSHSFRALTALRSNFMSLSLSFFFFVFRPFRATPAAYGGSQARGSNWSYNCQPTPQP